MNDLFNYESSMHHYSVAEEIVASSDQMKDETDTNRTLIDTIVAEMERNNNPWRHTIERAVK